MCIAIRLKYAHSSLDIWNQRCTNVQNCIVLKCECDTKTNLRGDDFLPPPPPNTKSVPTALSITHGMPLYNSNIKSYWYHWDSLLPCLWCQWLKIA